NGLLKEKLRTLLYEQPSNPDPYKPFAQADATDAWLQGQRPGQLIKLFIANVSPYGLSVRKRGKGGRAAAVNLWSLDTIKLHINELRDKNFKPCSYSKKGYLLRDSIKTDGFRLQVLAFKVRELLSVKFKRYKGTIPDRLTTTTAGTEDNLTEVRNVVKTDHDIRHYWICIRAEADQISYLGIDLGQTCVAGACALLPPGKTPTTKRRKKRSKKRKWSKRGARKSKRDGDRHMDWQPYYQDRINRSRFFNLTVKQKAIVQPTFKHRRWMESQKGTAGSA
ncbi:hypothetical protein BGW38_004423, partial [Lunasporangiospora selenospora]